MESPLSEVRPVLVEHNIHLSVRYLYISEIRSMYVLLHI